MSAHQQSEVIFLSSGWWWKTASKILLVTNTFLLVAVSVFDVDTINILISLGVLQIGMYAWRDKSTITFPVQIRWLYLALLLLGVILETNFVYYVLLALNLIDIIFSYTLLARMAALFPWNRTVPLSQEVFYAVFFSQTDTECILRIIADVGLAKMHKMENSQ
ncbi:MAG: hypothetical protein OEW37_09015 [Rhodospirillaceae bacterium]|nr:hypothetical protein [Rhodospirillaceae bacterium]